MTLHQIVFLWLIFLPQCLGWMTKSALASTNIDRPGPISSFPSISTTSPGVARRQLLFGISLFGVGWNVLPQDTLATSPLDAGEAIRRSAANIPGYGSTDVFYPDSFAGSWKMTREVELGGRSESTISLTYPIRFIRSIENGTVVADRGYNQAELEKALFRVVKYKSDPNSDADVVSPIRSYEWSQSNPNDLRIVMADGAKKEIKVTKRATERTDDTVSSSEFQRVAQENQRDIPVISARRVVSKWKQTGESTVEGIEIVYDMGGGDPLATAGTGSANILSKSRIYLSR